MYGFQRKEFQRGAQSVNRRYGINPTRYLTIEVSTRGVAYPDAGQPQTIEELLELEQQGKFISARAPAPS